MITIRNVNYPKILLRTPRQQVFLVAKSYGNVMKSLKCSGNKYSKLKILHEESQFLLVRKTLLYPNDVFQKEFERKEIMMSPKILLHILIYKKIYLKL